MADKVKIVELALNSSENLPEQKCLAELLYQACLNL
jgi:hypothetical protein